MSQKLAKAVQKQQRPQNSFVGFFGKLSFVEMCTKRFQNNLFQGDPHKNCTLYLFLLGLLYIYDLARGSR